MHLRSMKSVIWPVLTLGIALVCGGCTSAMIESNIKKSGAGYAEAEVITSKPKDLELPLACFTLCLDSSNVPSDTVTPGNVWLFDVTNMATLKLTSVQVKLATPAKYGPKRNPTQLIVLRLPPGEYLLSRILFANDASFSGTVFKPKYIGLDRDNKFTFTVKDSKVTYTGRITMKFTGERHMLGGVNANSIDYTVEWSDTITEDQKWAKEVFPCLGHMPSDALPMQKKSP